MKIEWNKVTWYSKLLALALFVALPFIGFYYGIKYGETLTPIQFLSQSTSTQVSGNNYYQNVAEWQLDQRTDGGFSISYPIDFSENDIYAVTPVTDWRIGSNNQAGIKMLTITIPRTFESQTNFSDATLTVGRSNDPIAVQNCLTPDQSGGPGSGLATTTINGVAFSIFTSASAGAGNFYETTSYRTLHANQCYAVEYTIHSNQIANYPSSYGLQPFDKNKLTDVLDRIVGTFRFL
jgi:hypothetical protein